MTDRSSNRPTWIARLGSAIISRAANLSPNTVGYGVLTISVAILALIVTVIGTYYQINSYRQDAGPQIPWDREAFFEAIHVGDLQTIEYFLNRGMSPHVVGDDRQLSMFLAKNTDSGVKVLNLLLRYKLNVNHPYPIRTAVGAQTAPILYYAVLNDNEKLVEELIRHGADVNVAVDIEGGMVPQKSSALDLARSLVASSRRTDATTRIIRLLEDAGAR